MHLGFIVPRDLREVSYPELCAWAKEQGFAFVDTHKVLPDGGHVARAAGLRPGVPTVTAATANEIFSPNARVRDGAVHTLHRVPGAGIAAGHYRLPRHAEQCGSDGHAGAELRPLRRRRGGR